MAEYHEIVVGRFRVKCDRCGRVETTTYQGEDRFTVVHPHLARLAEQGWRVYRSRSRRAYCPDCEPRPGHRMRLMFGAEGGEQDG